MNNVFGGRMKRVREEKNLTLEEIAQIIGLSKGTVSRYENGEIENIPLGRVEEIANILDVSPDTAKETVAVTDTAKETDTVEVADTVTDTVTSPLIKPTDIYVRKVCYLLEHQAKYVVKMAKKYKVTEAEIMRIAVEELKKSGKI